MIRRLRFREPARVFARRVFMPSFALVWISCGDGDVIGDAGLGRQGANSAAAHCGDGTVSVREQCDDGNTNAGDGCSINCMREMSTSGSSDAGVMSGDAAAANNSADAAQAGSAPGANSTDAGAALDASDANGSTGTNADSSTPEGGKPDASVPAEPLCPAEPIGVCETCNCDMCRMQIDACTNLPGSASEGPGVGTTRSALCEALVRCGRNAGCRGIECLCGSDPMDPMLLPNCLTGVSPPMGQCKNEALAAAETTDIPTFIQRASGAADTYAVAAAKAVSDCAMSSCSEACAPPASP